jgi:hypothetical protein
MNERLDVIDELERRLIDSCYRSRPWYVRVRSGRTLVPAAGLVVAAAAVIAVGVALLPGGGVSPPPALAALNSAARASARTGSTAIGPGEEWYVRIVVADTLPAPAPSTQAGGSGAGVTRLRSERQVWMRRDGATTTRTTTRVVAGGKLDSSARPTTQRTAGHGTLSSPLLPVPLLSYRRLRTLPANTAGLLRVVTRIRARLRAGALRAQRQAQTTTTPAVTTTRHGGHTTVVVHGTATVVGRCCGTTPVQQTAVGNLNLIAWLLALPVTAQVRAALYRTAATLPGVRYEGEARDALGRRGVAVAVGSGDDQMQMIFDPHSGALLASSSGFGASALANGFGPLVETVAVEKVVRRQP